MKSEFAPIASEFVKTSQFLVSSCSYDELLDENSKCSEKTGLIDPKICIRDFGDNCIYWFPYKGFELFAVS